MMIQGDDDFRDVDLSFGFKMFRRVFESSVWIWGCLVFEMVHISKVCFLSILNKYRNHHKLFLHSILNITYITPLLY